MRCQIIICVVACSMYDYCCHNIISIIVLYPACMCVQVLCDRFFSQKEKKTNFVAGFFRRRPVLQFFFANPDI